MLKMLRNSVSSWVGIGILALALGALVVTLFQPTGPVNAPGASGPVMATVGRSTITESEFLVDVERAAAREREQQPNMTQADFINAGGGELVFDQMLMAKAINEYAAVNKMAVSRRVVDGEIASIPAAQVNGKFDDATFRRLLQNQRLSEAELRESIANDIKRRQLLLPVASSTVVPRAMAEPYAALLLEVRDGSIIAVPSGIMPDPGKPTDEQLADFHKENARAYTIPERRAYRYALLTPEALTARAQPTEEEIAADFKARAAEYGGAELRDVNFVVLSDERKALALVKAVRGGQPFAEAAAAEGFTAADIALGRRPEAGLADELREDVARAAFALKAVGVTDPIATPFGFYVLEVAAIVPPQPRSLDSVRGEIAERLLHSKREALLSELVARADESLAGGESLVDVAKALELELEVAPLSAADGRVFADDLSVERHEQPILSHVFAADEADGPQVVDLGEGRFALFEISDVAQPQLVPLARIREDVELAWALKARSDAARAAADGIATALGKGETLRAAIGDLRLPKPQNLSVRRLELSQMAQQGQEIPPPVAALLSTSEGQARVIAAPGGQGWFVVKVAKVTPGDLQEAPQLVDVVRQGFAQQAADEMVQGFVRAVEREVVVVRQPDVLAASKRRITGAFE